jgi:hypothetical protein
MHETTNPKKDTKNYDLVHKFSVNEEAVCRFSYIAKTYKRDSGWLRVEGE